MRRFVCLIGAMLLCFMLASPALAATETFVPSIGEKDGPAIVLAVTDEDENVGSCLVVTSIKAAQDKTTDIPQEARDLLLEVYEQLDNGTMTLPLDNDCVIRELVDVSFRQTSCVEVPHGHKEWLAEDDTSITVKFDLGIDKSAKLDVLTYIDNTWVPVTSVTNNGDGTVTVVFEDICPVAFCVDQDITPPATGDAFAGQLPMWIALMAGSLAALVAVVMVYRKTSR